MNFFDFFINYYVKGIFGPTFIVTEIIACLSIAFLFNDIKYKNYKSWLIFGFDVLCTFVFNILFSCAYSFFLGMIKAQSVIIILSFIKFAIYGLIHAFVKKDYPNIYMRLFLAFSCGFFIAAFIELSGQIGDLFSPEEPFLIFKDITFYILALSLIGTMFFYKYISPFKYRFTKPLPSILVTSSYAIGLIAVTSIVLIQNIPQAFVITVLLIVIILLVLAYFVFYFNVKNYNQMIYFQISALKKENEINEINVSKQQFEEYHRLKHDLKNELSVLNTLYKNKEYEKMDEYFADVNEKIHVKIDSADTGNIIINSILDMEIAKAKSFGIKIDYSVVVPALLNFINTDLTSLLCNLLDNAIEAEGRANIFEPIKLSILYQKPNLFITVINKFNPSENPSLFKSKKADRRNHGYGTRIIESIIKENNGTSNIIVDKNTFTYEVMLVEKINEDE